MIEYLRAGSDDGIVQSIIGLGLGLWMFWKGFRELKLKRLIEGIATSKIRSMAMGAVELAGTAIADKALIDPVFGLDCVYYSLKIERQQGSGKNSRWVLVHQDSTDSLPFYLQDETGKVLLLPGGADFHCDTDINVSSNGFNLFGSKQDPIEKFMRLRGGGGTLRLTATILREHEPLYVLGWVAPLEDPYTLREKLARKAKQALHAAVQALKADAEKMKALDANGNGAVDGQEWDAAVRRLQQEAQAQGVGTPQDNPIVVRKSPEGLLIISDKTEAELIPKIGRWALVKIICGPALTLLCAACLFAKFG